MGYHLGTLDYLDRSALLPQVHTLSSVSGGSLVAIGYALSLKKGEDFQEFYDNICEFLPELNTLEELLKVMQRREPPVASGARTLITAMAEVYHEKFFDRYYRDPTFGVFWKTEPEIPLKEIIINATEFKTGIAFRFQKSPFASLIGNGKVWIGQEYAKQMRMSDIMAASSCIPVAMEPMRFPQDFHWPDDPAPGRRSAGRPTCEAVERSLKEHADVESIPLMDGGIYDNQGITSIILSVARNRQDQDTTGTTTIDDLQAGLEPIRPTKWAKWVLSSMERGSRAPNQKDLGDVDLFIVSDTPVRKDPMYDDMSTNGAPRGRIERWLRGLTIGTVNAVVWTITVLLGISVFALLNPPDDVSGAYQALYWLESAFLTLLAVMTTVGVLMLRRKARNVADNIDREMGKELNVWSYAKTLRVGTLIDMASLRATSMSALTARIFMNRIRQLGYSLLYSHDEFRKRVMDNNINDINSLAEGHSDDMPDFVKNPSKALKDVVKRAAEMGTKLWIDRPKEGGRHDLDVLIAAGHVSTCFNVIEYLWEFHRYDRVNLNDNVKELFEFVQADWQKFNDDPYWLVDERNCAGRAPGGLFWLQGYGKVKRRFRFGSTRLKTA